MKRRIRATWVSRKERSIWCCDFSDFGNDREALQTEIDASLAVIRLQSDNSLLVAVDLCRAEMNPEIAAFFAAYAGGEHNPIHKMAVLGVSDLQQIWYRLAKKVSWPKNARFFSEWERAKDWLVDEI
jgi:hypothetical protein